MEKKYSIKEVAELFHISTNKIRFYEKKGILSPLRDDENNYRYFGKEDILKLQTLLMYRMLDIPVEDIKNLMEHDEKENLLNHVHKQWQYVNNQMHQLRGIQQNLEEMMDVLYEDAELGDEELHKKMLSFVHNTDRIHQIKNSWKDLWNFDGWAGIYDDAVKKNVGRLGIYENYEEILEKVYQKAIEGRSSSSKVLEIGVGTGNLARKFLESDYEITGIDQSREMLNVAKKKCPQLKLRMGEFLKIPFEKDTFDIIVSTYAFHHLNDQEKEVAIEEMFRVLKEDGRIVLGDMMFESQESKDEILKTLTKEEIAEVEDEFYTDIQHLQGVFENHQRKLAAVKIDRFNHMIYTL